MRKVTEANYALKLFTRNPVLEKRHANLCICEEQDTGYHGAYRFQNTKHPKDTHQHNNSFIDDPIVLILKRPNFSMSQNILLKSNKNQPTKKPVATTKTDKLSIHRFPFDKPLFSKIDRKEKKCPEFHNPNIPRNKKKLGKLLEQMADNPMKDEAVNIEKKRAD